VKISSTSRAPSRLSLATLASRICPIETLVQHSPNTERAVSTT